MLFCVTLSLSTIISNYKLSFSVLYTAWLPCWNCCLRLAHQGDILRADNYFKVNSNSSSSPEDVLADGDETSTYCNFRRGFQIRSEAIYSIDNNRDSIHVSLVFHCSQYSGYQCEWAYFIRTPIRSLLCPKDISTAKNYCSGYVYTIKYLLI